MTELSGTIKFQVMGDLNLVEVGREINRLRDERIPKAAELKRLTCQVDDDGTKCSLKWELKALPQ